MNRLLCSTDMRLLRKCPCPLWLINPSKSKHHRKILAAVDFDPFGNKQTNNALNQQIIEMSISLALSEFFELHIVHVWHAYGESTLRSGFAQKTNADIDAYVEEIHAKHRRTLENFVTESISKAGKEVAAYLKPKIHLVKGLAIDVIPKMVKDNNIGVVMMGTVGRTGIPGFFMGNTADMILCRIDCSVLAIKPEGFVTPVVLEGL